VRGIWLAVAGVALGCAEVQVTARAMPGTDFSGFATYAQAAAEPDAASAGRIRGEIARALEAKGYRAAPQESADLRVAFRVGGEERIRQKNAGDPDANYFVEQNYVEGTLVIEIFASDRADPIWIGTGRSDSFQGERAEERVAGAARAILASFPPASASATPGGP